MAGRKLFDLLMRPTGAARAPATPDPPPSIDESPAAHDMRERLVAGLVADGEAHEPAVIQALRAVPRHLFAPGLSLPEAYADHAMPIGRGQTISQPAIVARMTEALELGGHERVLEIGTGSGYQAAVLSLLAREIFTVERIAELADDARARLAGLGYANVRVRTGDGYEGWPEEAPFDRIVITAAPDAIPPALLDQLGPGGILVAPVGEQGPFGQRLVRLRRRNGTLESDDLGGVAFVEMVPGEEP